MHFYVVAKNGTTHAKLPALFFHVKHLQQCRVVRPTVVFQLIQLFFPDSGMQSDQTHTRILVVNFSDLCTSYWKQGHFVYFSEFGHTRNKGTFFA